MAATRAAGSDSLQVLFLEPFYGGSHRAFADGLRAASRHHIDVRTMPARFWKWRMRGAALHFAESVQDPERFDVLLLSDLMSLADLRALWGQRCPPAVVYFHENQLSYPVPEGERRDVHFGFTDISTGLAADAIVFNSKFHRDAFFAELPRFLNQMPEHVPRWVVDELRTKATVLYPGCDLPEPARAAKPASSAKQSSSSKPDPLLIWNHRWEFDKRPDAFFAVLRELADTGVPFEVALLGENFQIVPQAFERSREWLGARVVQYGYIERRSDYWDLLRRGDVVVSTAAQENFGISVVEAVWAGNYPLVPARLAYPEVIPAEFHEQCLYADDADLVVRLGALLQRPTPGGIAPPPGLASAMDRYSWRTLGVQFDELLTRIAHNRR